MVYGKDTGMSREIDHHKFIVVGMEHYNPLGLIRTLGKCGVRPDFIAQKGKGPAASKSKYIDHLYLVNSAQEEYDLLLEKYGNCEEKPFVITTDDDIQSILDLNCSGLKENFFIFNAGTDGRVTKYMDKYEILEIAQKHGLDVLPTIVVDRGKLPEGPIEYPVITKSISPNIGGWKSDVHICNSEEELLRAFDHILSPKVLIQKFLEKENECCLEGLSINQGKKSFIPMAVKYNYMIPGYYSPFMTAYDFKNEILKSKVEKLIEDIGFEGMYDVEFLIGKDGTYYFSEINFRNSIWNYIAYFIGMPYPIIWAESTLSGTIDKSWIKSFSDGYTAMCEPIDYGLRVENGRTSLARWLMDYKKTNVLFYYDEEDLEPFEEMVNHWKIYS